MAHEEKKPGDPAQHKGYEESDVNVPIIFQAVIGLTVLIVLSLGAMAALQYFYTIQANRHDKSVSPLAQQRVLPPEPRLQATPAQDLKKIRAEEKRVLTSYEVIDAPKGVIRIPVERAMELTAQRGLPFRGKTEEKKKENA